MMCSEIKAGYSAISSKTYLPTYIHTNIYTYLHIQVQYTEKFSV